jgi:hypothetical protein
MFSLGVISGKSGKRMFMIVVSWQFLLFPKGLPIVILLFWRPVV